MQQDNLINKGYMKLSTALTVQDLIHETDMFNREFDCPIFCIHGKLDRIALSKGSENFYDKVKTKDKTFILFEGIIINYYD